jgi:Icc protein
VILAQLTDTHVLEDGEAQFLDNNGMLAQAISSLNAENPKPDAVIGTGDLTNWAREAQYEKLAELFAELDLPFFPMVGNHDDRALLKQTFPDVPWAEGGHASWMTDIDGVRVVALDSTDPGRNGAAFDRERRVWLESALETDGATILAMHHPPFTTGVDWMDAQGFIGIESLHEVIADNADTIVRIVCGHFHRPVVTTVSGVTTSVCPATVHHIQLDLVPGSEPSLIRDPRGYQLHLVDGTDVVTHTRYIDTGESAFDPGWD